MRIILGSLFLIFGSCLHAQPFNLMNSCQAPSDYAGEVFSSTLQEARNGNFIPQIILCRNTNVPNAYAWSFPDPWSGQPIFSIHYNPDFMAQLDVTRSGDWAQVALFAHEIGHIVEFAQRFGNGWRQQFGFNNPWSMELFADNHAGQVLARMGAEPKEIGDALLFLFSLHGSPTHPDTVSRLQAMHEGYAAAGGDTTDLETPDELAQRIFEEMTRW